MKVHGCFRLARRTGGEGDQHRIIGGSVHRAKGFIPG